MTGKKKTSTKTRLNLAFIGNGKGTNRYHLPFVRKLPALFNVKTIYSRSGRQNWPIIDGVHYTTDLAEILDDPEIDCVVISTPHSTHYELAKKALEAGKHVVVDKPFMPTLEQAKELFALAKEKGLMLQGYQNRRFDSYLLTAKKVLEEGKLKDLQEIELCFDYYRPEQARAIDHYDPYNSFLYGHGAHTIDQIISLFGVPDKVHYDLRQFNGQHTFNDYYDIDLYYGHLKVSAKASFYRVKPRPAITIYASNGMFIKEGQDRQEEDLKHFYLPDHDDFGKDRMQDYGTLIYYDEQGGYHEEKVESIDGDYSLYYQALYETLVNGKEPLVRPEQTLQVMAILDAGAKMMD